MLFLFCFDYFVKEWINHNIRALVWPESLWLCLIQIIKRAAALSVLRGAARNRSFHLRFIIDVILVRRVSDTTVIEVIGCTPAKSQGRGRGLTVRFTISVLASTQQLSEIVKVS